MGELTKNLTADHYDDSHIPVATHQIYDFIKDYLSRKEDSTDVNRASAASMCFKRRWYQRNGHKGEMLTPRKIVNFTLGDLSEHTVKYFILKGCVGPGKLYSEVHFGKEIGSFTIQNGKQISIYEQETLSAQIGQIKVSAHVDGWGKRNSDGKWELIEVKSAADYGYDEFVENGPGDYLKQAMVNLSTCRAKELGAGEVRFFYLKKNTGHIWDRAFPFDESLFSLVVKEYALSNLVEEPDAPHGPQPETFRGKPTGRMLLKFPCNYCPYTAFCQPSFEIEIKAGRPVYVLKKN